MRKKSLLDKAGSVALLFAFLGSQVFASEANLIDNSSFELFDAEKNPQGWVKVHHPKNISIHIYPIKGANYKGAGAGVISFVYKIGDEGWATQKIPVIPNSQYKFSEFFTSSAKSYLTAKFYLSDGSVKEEQLKTLNRSSKWQASEVTFIAPEKAVSVAVSHSLRSLGYLGLDDFSLISVGLPADTIPPVITIKGQNPVEIKAGEIYVDAGAEAIDDVDGNLTSFIETSGDVNTSEPGVYPVVYSVSDKAGNKASAVRTVNVIKRENPPPVEDKIAPVITILGNNPVAINLGAEYVDYGATAIDETDGDITSAIISSSNVNTAVAGSYAVLYSVSDKAGNNTTDTRTVDVKAPVPPPPPPSTDITAPDVSIVDPVSETTLSSVVVLRVYSVDTSMSSAPASGVKQVQFYVDGSPVGSPVLALPYMYVLDTTLYSDGEHKIGASATDNAGNTSAVIETTVSFINNGTADFPMPNAIINNGFESGGANSPDGWNQGAWGVNDASFNYPVAGKSGNGAEIKITNLTDGDAKWFFDDVKVNPGEKYSFSNFYKSTARTRVTARFTLLDGTFLYLDLGYPEASENWKQFVSSFTAPSSVNSMTVFHLIEAPGTLTVDDYYLNGSVATGNSFVEGMVSFTFDDGWESTFKNGLPILNSAGIKSTNYIISEVIGDVEDGYATLDDILQAQAQGHEIGSHSKTHPDLTAISHDDMVDEVANSKRDLEALGAKSITSIAFPFGNWNESVKQAVKDAGYIGSRTALVQNEGLNYRDGDPYLLKTISVESNTSINDIKYWIDQAVSTKTWIILVFHKVDGSGEQYSITPEKLTQITDYVRQKIIKTITISQGLYLMK